MKTMHKSFLALSLIASATSAFATSNIIAFTPASVSVTSVAGQPTNFTLTLKNISGTTTGISLDSHTPALPSDVVLDPSTTTCTQGFQLAAGATCNYGYIYTPTTATTQPETMTVIADENTAGNSTTATVSLSATSPTPTVPLNFYAFGANTDSTNATPTVQITPISASISPQGSVSVQQAAANKPITFSAQCPNNAETQTFSITAASWTVPYMGLTDQAKNSTCNVTFQCNNNNGVVTLSIDNSDTTCEVGKQFYYDSKNNNVYIIS